VTICVFSTFTGVENDDRSFFASEVKKKLLNDLNRIKWKMIFGEQFSGDMMDLCLL
jgi:hypothetical protein